MNTVIESDKLSLENLIKGYWWFFYPVESINRYAVRWVDLNTYSLTDINDVNLTIVATNKDDLLKEVLSYFNENKIELCDIFQDEY